MAAFMSTSSSSSESDENTEKLDPLSPIFDPRRALYAKSVKVPIPDARQFNNLAEFENFLKGKDSETLKKSKKEKQPLPGIIAERAAAQAREAVRKAAILAKSEGPHERSQTQMRKMRSTNVFTRIEGYQGPLAILRKCMQEKLKVVVVIRAAVSVRSRCKGFVIAFDKHFNMALMDVDETYIRMSKKRKEKSKANTESPGDASSQSISKPDKLQVSQAKEGAISKTTQPVVQMEFSEISQCDSPQRTKLSETYKEKCNISSPKVSSGARAKSQQGQSIEESVPNKSKKKSSCNEQTDPQVDQQSGKNDSKGNTEKKAQTANESSIDNKSGIPAEQMDTQDSQEKTEGVSGPAKVKVADFWESYIAWAEKRCLSKFELLERHVNQLFIRGDNVVSVSLAQ